MCLVSVSVTAFWNKSRFWWLSSDLQAVEEVGGRRLREVQLSLLALLEETVQVGVLAKRDGFIKSSSKQLKHYLESSFLFKRTQNLRYSFVALCKSPYLSEFNCSTSKATENVLLLYIYFAHKITFISMCWCEIFFWN